MATYFTFVAFNIILANFDLVLAASTTTTIDVDPMCTNDHTGGLGCNFEKGICGGIVTEHDPESTWAWAHTDSGPIGTHVHSPTNAVTGGHYIYLDGAKTDAKTATLELFLSPEETSICLSLHYATTGAERLVLRVAAQYETGNTLLDERQVSTAGQWDHFYLPLCLIGGQQRSFLTIEVEGFSVNQTIAIDYLEITKSLRTCDGKTFSLQCSCAAHPIETPGKKDAPPESSLSQSSNESAVSEDKGSNKSVLGEDMSQSLPMPGAAENPPKWPLVKDSDSGCTFKAGLCKGMSLTQSHMQGTRWTLGDAGQMPLSVDGFQILSGHYLYLEAGEEAQNHGPAHLLLDLPRDVSEAVRVRIGYTVLGDRADDTKFRVFFQHPHQKTLLMEITGDQAGHHRGEINLDCCMDAVSLERQIIIEGGYEKSSNNKTVVIYYVDVGQGSAICPSDTLTTPVPDAISTDVSAGGDPESTHALEKTEIFTIPSSPALEKTEIFTIPSSPALEKTETSTIPSSLADTTTSTAGAVVMQAVEQDNGAGSNFPVDLSAIIAACVSSALIIVLVTVGTMVWRRRRSHRNLSVADRPGVYYKHTGEEGVEISDDAEGSTRMSNPIYGIYGTHAAIQAAAEISLEPPVSVMNNFFYGGTSEA